MINIEDIKQQLSVNKVIGYYLKGDSTLSWFHKYLSPFKKEKTPSLVATDSKGLWKDFSSQKWGDIFKFVKEYKGYNFWETLNEFKNVFGIDIDLSTNEYDRENAAKQSKIYEIHDLIVDFCHKAILEPKNKGQLKYLLEDRGLSMETIERFKLWFSEKRHLEDFVSKLLEKEEYDGIKKPDVSLFNDKSSFLFSDRIMYPVRTMFGKVVAFSGGRIYPDQEPKYIHSTNNFIYEKSHNLLNLDKVDFTSKDIFICEGNIDTIQLYNYGGTKSIALLWTSLSESQINSFVNRIDEVTLLLDTDSAGTRAMYEVAKKMYSRGKSVYVFNMGKSKDIDEFLLSHQELKGNIDNHIDDNKKEIMLELLIPSYVKKELTLWHRDRQEMYNKIRDIYVSVPECFDALKRNMKVELKKWDIDFFEFTHIKALEEEGFPELTKSQEYDMTGREIAEYNKLRKDYIKRSDEVEKNIEKDSVEPNKEMLATYINEYHKSIEERIIRWQCWGLTVKTIYMSFLEKKVKPDDEFMLNSIWIDEVLNSKPDEYLSSIFNTK